VGLLRRWLGCVAILSAAGAVVPVAGLADACEERTGTVVVHVHGVRSDKGMLVAVLYGDNQDDFLKKGRRLARERAPARPGSVTLCLGAPRPGVYAVAVYHDENGNRRIDRSWTSLPTEGFGLSNNPRPVLRAPTHAESAFEVGTGPTVVNIELRY
jgi:uncharacterized protein (DUF2141 family)